MNEATTLNAPAQYVETVRQSFERALVVGSRGKCLQPPPDECLLQIAKWMGVKANNTERNRKPRELRYRRLGKAAQDLIYELNQVIREERFRKKELEDERSRLSSKFKKWPYNRRPEAGRRKAKDLWLETANELLKLMDKAAEAAPNHIPNFTRFEVMHDLLTALDLKVPTADSMKNIMQREGLLDEPERSNPARVRL
jgi:hypothetical protein